jgi:Ner family transcriptional regulator
MDPIARAAKIRGDLFVRGLTFADIDRRYDLPEGTAYRTAHREPNAKGEAAISATLAVEANELWPERYEASGQRKHPQPPENYERPPTLRQRRNERAA